MSGDNKTNKTKRLSQILSVVLLLATCLVLVALKPGQHLDQRKGRTMQAAEFLDTLGVNTHVGSDPYNDPAKIASMLSYLGTRNIRQSSPIDDVSLSNMQALGKLGARFDLIINGGGPVNLPGALATARQMAPYLNAVEGVNEAAIWPISYGGFNGVDAAVALQKDLYAAVKADPALSKADVYIFTLGGVDPGAFPSIGDLSAYTDYANVHSYPPHGLRPCFVIHAAIDGGRTSAPSKPVVITETGYYTLPQNAGWGGVPEAVQANYLLGLLLDEAAAGVSRTYLYDLIDDGADLPQTNREDHFGLFHNDGSPKLAATAIHNLTTLLADPGAGSGNFPLDGFSFTATGVPYDYTGNTMQFQKSDGTHVVAVWNEQQLWDPDTQAATPVQHFPTTVDLHQKYGTVLIYDPTAGTAPVQTLHDVSSLVLDLTDHPLLVVVPPPGRPPAATAASAPVPAAGPVLAGQDALVLMVSEDAWNGDAQFNVLVDGVQQGTFTATAPHAAGAPQSISLTGSWGAGPHSIGIAFVNHAWGGTAATDRNLYVDGVSYDGIGAAGAPATLFSNGVATFGVAAASASAAKGTALTLHLAEDEWQGDARCSVAIDGGTIVRDSAVTASNGEGRSQAVDLHALLAPGPHDIGLSFLNDAYGGTAATDRNLYVKGIDVGGVPIPGMDATLFAAGTAHFQIMVPWGGV